MVSSTRSLNHGFTLIELLIVIALISILTAIASVSYAAVQKRARDARRVSDLKSVQNAYEQYYADNNNNYPFSNDCVIPSTYLSGGIPFDPKTGDPYFHPNGCTTTSYCFCALLDNGGGNASTNNCTLAAGGQYYCVWQLQEMK
jgi:prepilin-type N-terminal cleavage/methylation domain-containing protein